MTTKKINNHDSRVHFHYLNEDIQTCDQEVIAALSEHELNTLIEKGYLVLDSYFSGEVLENLRAALERVVTTEKNITHESHEILAPKRFGGCFYNNLYRKELGFSVILKDPLLLATAKILFGPLIWARPLSARIVNQHLTNAETHWHQHLPTAPEPCPVWFMRAHTLEVLIYLDDVNEKTGSLIALPGSHKDPRGALRPDQYGDLIGQETICCNAGSIVLMHGGTFHRAAPGREVSLRRLLITAFQPTWMKRRSYGEVIEKLPEGYQDLAEANMLFGHTGYS